MERVRAAGRRVTEITLAPFDLAATTAWLGDCLSMQSDVKRLPRLAQLFQRKTGGNPSFMRQFVRHLSDKRALVFDATSHTWSAGD